MAVRSDSARKNSLGSLRQTMFYPKRNPTDFTETLKPHVTDLDELSKVFYMEGTYTNTERRSTLLHTLCVLVCLSVGVYSFNMFIFKST